MAAADAVGARATPGMTASSGPGAHGTPGAKRVEGDGEQAPGEQPIGSLTRPPRRTSGPPVRVGIHLGDNESAGAQFGVGGLPNVSPQEVDAIVRQVNAAGGLGGREIQPLYHRTDPLNGSFDTQGQRACEALIDDGRVELLIDNALTPSKVLMECSARKGVPLVWELHMVQITNAESARLGDLLYRPSMPNADRLGFIVDGLAEAGFFKDARVGIIRYDTREAELISKQVFRPRLAARNVTVASEYKVTEPDSSTDATRMSAQTSNAIVQFREDGVTHVLFVPSGGALPLVFLANAASQGWNPPYGLSTQDAPSFLAENYGSQLEESMVVGWVPNIDGDEPPGAPDYASCREGLAKAGLPWDPDVLPFCDALYFGARSLDRTDGFSRTALRSGVQSLGRSYRSPYIFSTRFGPGRHDGPIEARVMRYDTREQHFDYTERVVRFP